MLLRHALVLSIMTMLLLNESLQQQVCINFLPQVMLILVYWHKAQIYIFNASAMF